jgi:hypothetical protein
MENDKRLFDRLQEQSKIKELTIYIPPKEWSTKEKLLVAGGTVIAAVVTFFTGGAAAPVLLSIAGGSSAALVFANGAIVGGAVAYAQKNKIKDEKAKDENFYLININEGKKNLDLYNVLKISQIDLQKILGRYAYNDADQKILEFQDKQKIFKEEIKDAYQNFISYTIISPYLAYADYHIYLSNKTWFGHDNDELISAAEAMAVGAYKDILLEANSDVRRQFFNVYRKLKEAAGEKEWEDLKVLQTLTDTISHSKKTGIGIWWQ